jgi:hypothetical protein
VGQKIRIPIHIAERALSSVSIASSDDTTRPHLNGVCLRVKGSTFNMAATNGHWAALYCFRVDSEEQWVEEQMLITRDCVYRMVRELRWIMKHHKETDGCIEIDASFREYKTSIGTMKLDLSKESFPPFSKIFPEELPKDRSSTIMTIGPQYVKSIAEAFETASGEGSAYMLRWEVTKDWSSPVLVTAPSVPELTVICMGMRADDKHYKNIYKPRPSNFIFP